MTILWAAAGRNEAPTRGTESTPH